MADHPDAMAELRATLAARASRYGQAHIVVDTPGKRPAAIVKTILRDLALPAAPSE
jgi:hypothetical protein